MRIRQFSAALWGLLLLPLTVMATGQPGEPAADFTLFDTQNVSHTLSDHADEVVYMFLIGYS